ncbi:MAG: hypothetical protein WD894_03270 [Pirellulales bacterium]
MPRGLITALILIGLMQASDARGSTELAEVQAVETKAKTDSATAPAKAADDDLTRQARRLVRQLDAAEIAARDRAFAELVKLGPGVLEHLPKASDNPPAAVGDAVRRLRREFDRQAADQAMQAATITLQGKGIGLPRVAEEFEKQTGNKLVLETPAETTVDVDLEKAPFWKALDTIADRAKLSVYSFAQDGVQLRSAMPDQRPRSEGAFYNGPLRFQATGLRLERDLRTHDEALLHVALEVSWEPRLRPITLRQKLDAVQARDEQGGPLSVAGQGERSALVHQGASAVELELPLKAPPRSVQSIATLKGTVEVLIPGKLEAFEFSGLENAKKTEQQRHNATVTLDSVRKVNDVWEVRVRVKYAETFNAFDSHLVSWLLNNEAYLVDSKGARMENGGFETTNRTEDEIGVAYFFEVEQGLAGHKFVYQTPSTIYQLPVQYELKDLELP